MIIMWRVWAFHSSVRSRFPSCTSWICTPTDGKFRSKYLVLFHVIVNVKGSCSPTGSPSNRSLLFRAWDKGHLRESPLLLVLIAYVNLLGFPSAPNLAGMCLYLWSSLLLSSFSFSTWFCPHHSLCFLSNIVIAARNRKISRTKSLPSRRA